MEVYLESAPHTEGGWSVVWFNPRTERVSYWYGTRQACVARMAGPYPRELNFHGQRGQRSYADTVRD